MSFGWLYGDDEPLTVPDPSPAPRQDPIPDQGGGRVQADADQPRQSAGRDQFGQPQWWVQEDGQWRIRKTIPLTPAKPEKPKEPSTKKGGGGGGSAIVADLQPTQIQECQQLYAQNQMLAARGLPQYQLPPQCGGSGGGGGGGSDAVVWRYEGTPTVQRQGAERGRSLYIDFDSPWTAERQAEIGAAEAQVAELEAQARRVAVEPYSGSTLPSGGASSVEPYYYQQSPSYTAEPMALEDSTATAMQGDAEKARALQQALVIGKAEAEAKQVPAWVPVAAVLVLLFWPG